jgi:hypothetical protein
MPQAAAVISMADYRKSTGQQGNMSRRPVNTLSEARNALARSLAAKPDFSAMSEFEIPGALMHWQNQVVSTMRQVLAI